MKTRFTFPLLFVTLLFTLQSCFSPQNIVKLQPEKEDGKWRYGQHFVADSLYGVIYEVGFERLNEERYWFDFNIVNRSNLPVMINPVDFYCQPFDGTMQPLTEQKIRAINPEDEIMEAEKELSKIEARDKNRLGLSLLAASVDIATGIAVEIDENPHNDFMRTHLFHDVQATRAENEFDALDLNEMMDAWKSSTIRKTTLESNYSMQGKVFFPAFREAAYIKLYLPVDSQFVELIFKQIQFPVN